MIVSARSMLATVKFVTVPAGFWNVGMAELVLLVAGVIITLGVMGAFLWVILRASKRGSR
jgi:hypothetical protein